MKKILLLFSFIAALLIVFLIGGGQALAQTPEDEARKHGITFPIAELGNCTNFSDCRNYCEDPVNRTTCIDFAKKKGFHREEKIEVGDSQFWQKTKAGLGCDSLESCQALCEQPANFEKCSNFAKSQGLGGGHVEDPTKGAILDKAKEVLGCSSHESCKSYCENEANIQKCSEFARQTGLRGGERIEGPGGCNSPDSCKTFCSDPNNYEICSKFHSAASGQTFQGPGGCNSEESCKAYCEQNPSACGNIGGASEASHAEYCNKTPNCSWTGNTCQCSGFEETTPPENINPDEYCKQYPERCNFSPYPSPTASSTYSQPPTTSQTGSYDPGAECTKTPGCSWTGSTCTCGGVQGASTQKGWIETILEMLLRMK